MVHIRPAPSNSGAEHPKRPSFTYRTHQGQTALHKLYMVYFSKGRPLWTGRTPLPAVWERSVFFVQPNIEYGCELRLRADEIFVERSPTRQAVGVSAGETSKRVIEGLAPDEASGAIERKRAAYGRKPAGLNCFSLVRRLEHGRRTPSGFERQSREFGPKPCSIFIGRLVAAQGANCY